jgi:hypothetical protein
MRPVKAKMLEVSLPFFSLAAGRLNEDFRGLPCDAAGNIPGPLYTRPA